MPNLIEPYAKLCVQEKILNHKSYLSTETANLSTVTTSQLQAKSLGKR
jgi:hypothetical protein